MCRHLQDQYGNASGFNMGGYLVVTIQPCDQSLKSSEVPTFEGSSSRLTLPLRNGEVILQVFFFI